MVQRKPLKKSGTPKQQKAAELLVENSISDKPQPVGAILLQAGYAKGTAIKPTQVTRSDGFIAIMESLGLDDNKLAEVLRDGLEAQTYIKTERVEGIGKSRLKTEDVVSKPDHAIRHRYLETGLRLKGLGKASGDININFNNHVAEQRKQYNIA